MTTQRVQAAARLLHRAGEHDLAEDVADGDVTVAGAVKILRRRDEDVAGAGKAGQLADQLAELPADPKPAEPSPDTPPPTPADPPAPDPADNPNPAGDPAEDVEARDDDTEDDPPPDPKPEGAPPIEDHPYLRPLGRKRDK